MIFGIGGWWQEDLIILDQNSELGVKKWSTLKPDWHFLNRRLLQENLAICWGKWCLEVWSTLHHFPPFCSSTLSTGSTLIGKWSWKIWAGKNVTDSRRFVKFLLVSADHKSALTIRHSIIRENALVARQEAGMKKFVWRICWGTKKMWKHCKKHDGVHECSTKIVKPICNSK